MNSKSSINRINYFIFFYCSFSIFIFKILVIDIIIVFYCNINFLIFINVFMWVISRYIFNSVMGIFKVVVDIIFFGNIY